MLVGNADKAADLKDLRENHTESTVSFTLIATKEKIDEFESSKGGLITKFKLGGSLTTSNMTLFDMHGKIVKFETPIDIMETFYNVRMEFYSKRKDNLIRNLEEEKKVLGNKARFVDEVCSGKVIVSNRKRIDLLVELQARGYDLIGKQSKHASEDENELENDETEDDAPSIAELAKGYEYLLGMKIWSLTHEKAELLRSQLAEKVKELEELRATPPSAIWLRDLEIIEALLDDRDVAAKLAADDELRAKKKSDARQTKKMTKKVAGKKKKKDEWDSDMESDVEMNHMDNMDSEDDFFGTSSNAGRKRSATQTSKIISTKQITKTTDPEDAGLLSQITDSLIVSPPSKKRASDSSNGMDRAIALEEGDTKTKPKKKAAAVAATKVTKPRAKPALKKKSSKSTDDNEMKESKTKKVGAKKALKKNETKMDFDDSDSLDFDDDVAPAASFEKAKRSARSAPVYSFSDDDDSDF
jgi:DNA gyrase/topoisomerase IV, subunit A